MSERAYKSFVEMKAGERPAPVEGEMTRRDALRMVSINMASGVVAAAGVGKLAVDQYAKNHPHERADVASHTIPDMLPHESGKEDWQRTGYRTPKVLVGRKLDSYARRYMGWAPVSIHGKLVKDTDILGETIPPVDFAANLRALMQEKRRRLGTKPGSAHKMATYDYHQTQYETQRHAGTLHPMTLPQLRDSIAHESVRAQEVLAPAYRKITQMYFGKHLDTAKISDARRAEYESTLANTIAWLAEKITPEIMLAYIGTELLPDPTVGMAVLEFMAMHGGAEYLASVPSLGDDEYSIGPSQLTQDALESARRLLVIANAARLLPERLEEFVTLEQHFLAGYLFALHNVLALLQEEVKEGRFMSINPIIESAATEHSTVFLEYIAGAHHRPAVAREVLLTWVKRNQSLPAHERETTLTNCFLESAADREVCTYTEKAKAYRPQVTRALHASTRTH